MEFSVEEVVTGDVIRYFVKGYVNESAQFPPIRSAPVVRIDLSAAKGLNSIGTRNWCDWVHQIKPPSSLLIEKCPLIFIKSFNNVVGALTPSMHVVSFYVPFVAPISGNRSDVLISKEQVTNDGKLNLGPVVDSKGELMEMDVLDEYFRFLKR